MEVSSTKTLAYVLDRMGIDYKILSGTQADVFAKVHVSQLTAVLTKENCEVISLQEHDESLESYYIGLVGGSKNV